MTAKKNKSRIMLIIACVLSFVLLTGSAIAALMIGFNIGGITIALSEMLLQSGYAATEVDCEITVMLFTFVMEVFVELYFDIV